MMKEDIIDLIITACETGDKDFIETAIGILSAEGNKFSSQIETLANKVFDASKKDMPLEGLLDIIGNLIDKNGGNTDLKMEQVAEDLWGGDEEEDEEEWEDEEDAAETKEKIKTRKTSLKNRKKGKNLFDPNEYKHLYHDEDHKKNKAQSRPSQKVNYDATLVTVKCTGCKEKIKIPKALYAGKGTSTKCENCLIGE